MKWLVALVPMLVLLPCVGIGADTDDVCRQLGRDGHRLGLNRVSER